MATVSLQRVGSVHRFLWSGRRPEPGTVMITDRGVGYLVQAVRPARFLRASVLTVLCVDPAHPAVAHAPRAAWVWRGWRGHPKAFAALRRATASHDHAESDDEKAPRWA